MGWETRTITATIQVWVPDAPRYGSLPPGQTAYPVPDGALFVAPTGADGDPGTEERPFRTLKKAVAALKPGGTVVLRTGVYRESDIWNFVADSVIQSYPGEEVWLDGLDPVTDWTRDGNGWRAPYTRVTERGGNNLDLHLQGVGPVPAMLAVVTLDGKQLKQVGSRAELGPGKFWQEGALSGTLFTAAQLWIGDDPTGRDVRVSMRGICLTMHAVGQTVRGIGVRGYTAAMPDMGVMRMVRDRATLENVWIEDCAVTPCNLIASNTTLRNVTVLRAGELAMGGWRADNLRVEGCYVSEANIHGFNVGHGAGGLKTTKTQRVTVLDSTFENNAGAGIWWDDATYDTVIARSRVLNNRGSGIFIEISGKAVVAGCVVAGHEHGNIHVQNSDRVQIWNCTTVGGDFGVIRAVQGQRLPSDGTGNTDSRQPPEFYETDMTWVIGSHEGMVVRNCVMSHPKRDASVRYPALYRYETQGGWTSSRSWQDAKIDLGHNVYHRGEDWPTDLVSLWNGAGAYEHLRTSDLTALPDSAMVDREPLLDAEYALLPGQQHLHDLAAAPPSEIAALIGDRPGMGAVPPVGYQDIYQEVYT